MDTASVTPIWPDSRPDFERLRRVFQRDGLPDRVPFIELFADPEVVAAVLGEPLPPVPEDGADRAARRQWWRQRLRFCRRVGYDFVWAFVDPGLTIPQLEADDTAALSRGRRGWVNEAQGAIRTMADFEAYPWPRPQDIDYSALDFLTGNVPEGMKVIAMTSGVLEFVMWLMGYAPFALALHDDPDLVEAMFGRVQDLLAPIHETMCDYAGVGAVFLGDDMGHRGGTMIRPDHLRRYVFPRQKQLAAIAHDHGLPFLLHACGNLGAVMPDLIEDVGIDGKHSFEDTFLPVTEAKRLYGDRIAILGGVDMDFLTSRSEAEVRAYTRRLLEACMPGGGFAIGSGNTFANYVPVENYLAMLDETMKLGAYR